MHDQSTHPDIRQLRHRLGVIRGRIKLILIGRSVLISFSLIVGSIIALGYLDFLLRLPIAIRLITLAGLIALIYRCWVRYLRPAVNLRLSTVDIALEIERHEPTMRGLLASTVDLDEQNARPGSAARDDQIHHALTLAALRTANRRLAGQIYPPILKLNDFIKALVVCMLIGLGVALMGVGSPSLVAIGINRVLMPWSETNWPMRYAIRDTTPGSARPIDIAVPIRALIGSSQSGDDAASQARINWRVLDAQRRAITPWARAVLVAQHQRDPQSNTPIYEQLIDAQRAVSGRDDASFVLEYNIQTRDDMSEHRRITLVRPPELLGTDLEITLPQYALPIAESGLVRSGGIETTHTDSIISPILAQSRVRITWRFTKPIEHPENTIPVWAQALATSSTIESFAQPEPGTIELTLIADASATIEPSVRDTMGISVRAPIALALGVLADQNPGVSIITPQRDEAVSSRAIIEIRAQLADDLGLARGSITITHARAPRESLGASPEPIEPGVDLVVEQLRADLRAQLRKTLELDSLDLSPGDQVWIVANAWDIRDGIGADPDLDPLGMTRSAMRVLEIVDDATLIEQIRKGLNPIRNALRQLDDQQAQLHQLLGEGLLDTSDEQRSVKDRLETNRRTIEQLRQKLERNALDDPALESLLSDADSILGEAIGSAQRASDQLDRGNFDRAGAHQRVVRDRLGELLAMLDHGMDSWLALRSVRQLRDELASLRDATGEFNAQAAGRSLEALSAEQKSTLERILDRQLDLADDAREAMATLDEQAAQLQEHDPAQAQALRRAANQGRSAQIEQQLNEAAEQVGSNQTSSATATQSQVLEELDKMLEELENTIQNRDNALRRELASIIESIEQLIVAQTIELDRVDQPNADTRMIALMGNTLAVRDDALGAFPETRSIADLITQATQSQSNAIQALRQSPKDFDAATRFEQASVLNLRSALEEAQRLDDQAADRQARKLRDELRDAYRESLESQTALRDESRVMIGEELNRRQRAKARAIAATQESLREQLAQMLEQTKELGDAPVFVLAHAQLDRLMIQSSDGLGSRQIEQRVINAQNGSMTILATLVEVLSDGSPNQEPKDFDDGSSGGSGDGSGGSGDEPVIPPIAQLKLLRSMQQLAAMQTRAFGQDPGQANDADIEALSDLQRQLFEHGHKLIEDMSQSPSPSPEPSPAGPIESEEGTPSS